MIGYVAAAACAACMTYLWVMLRKERRRRNRALALVDEIATKNETLNDYKTDTELRHSKLAAFILGHFDVPRLVLKQGPRQTERMTVLEGDPVDVATELLLTHPKCKGKAGRGRKGG